MSRRRSALAWGRLFQRGLKTASRLAVAAARAAPRKTATATRTAGAAAGAAPGAWTVGRVLGPGGSRRFRLYRPPGLSAGDKPPLLVMLHGCAQDAEGFAASTRMNALARREGFLVLYPEQDRLANLQGCWNWFDTRSGRAQAEAALILQAVDQVCRLQAADRGRVAVVGLSAGASMAALLAVRHADRFRAVVMHSGVPPGMADTSLSALGAMRGRRAGGSQPAGAQAWPPLLVIHGDADGAVSVRNGRAAAETWAAAAGAQAGAARRVQRGRRRASTVTDYRRGGRTVARLVIVEGLGHAWSGGLSSRPFGDAAGPDASRMAWAFVAQQLAAIDAD